MEAVAAVLHVAIPVVVVSVTIIFADSSPIAVAGVLVVAAEVAEVIALEAGLVVELSCQ